MQLLPDAPQPRVCLVEKATHDQEYGYNLHAERGKDQFVGTVDKGSPAEHAGLHMGDRIFAVNGVSIQGESHKKVVERIKQDPMRCELLVIDEEGANWYKEHNITISPTLPNLIRISKDGETGRHSTNNNHEKSSGSPPPAAWYAPNGTAAKDPVFVAPPPPAEMGGRPRPTLCHLEKKSVTDEFGFNLHAEKGKGHFIGAVDVGGIGDRAGLKMAQRIVGVNGILIHPTTPHKEVVALIKKNPVSTTLLVAAEDVDAWYKQHNEAYSFEYADDGARPGAHTHHITIHHEEIYEYDNYASEHPIAEAVVAAAVLHRLESVVEEAEEQHHLAAEAAARRSRAPTADDVAAAVLAAVTVEAVLEKEAELAEAHHQHQEHAADDDIMAAVFGGIPATPTAEAPPLHEEHHHEHHEHHLGKEILVAAAIVHHEEKKLERLEEELERVDHRETPVMTPEPTVRSTASSYSKPIENGHHHSEKSNDAPRDIFSLSAAEARERLRANKRRDPRGLEMSLEEKYRIVSSM
ncbi:hypothetical protein PENTCL1PPCAC_18465 [Pristionchus entomophagus]|uniref:PDZ domain-containing protein n=1 Tax=Pristionchus entomophagus TaxID=358040 RepID=A0AAV5TPD8_9BILA|nr:hypothetical protein PENTCL1PPCAC_18465 [Pristionchus entomophagus]